MAVLPPDPLFRFKSDLGHLHSLCFLEPQQECHGHLDTKMENLSVIDENIDEIDESIDQKPAKLRKHFLLTAGESGIVYFFDLENNRLKYKQKMGASIQSVHTYRDEVIIQEKDGLVTIYAPNPKDIITIQDLTFDLEKSPPQLYEKLASLPCASGFCKMLRLHDRLLLPGEDSTVAIYNLKTKALITKLQLSSVPAENFGQMMCLETGTSATRFTSSTHLQTQSPKNPPQEDLIFAGFETGDIFLWNFASNTLLSHAKFNECIISITYDSISGKGVVGGAGGELQVFSVDRVTYAMKPLCDLTLTNDGCQVIKVRKDRKVLVSGGFDGRTRIYSWKTLRLLAALTENHACVTDVQFSEEVVPLWGSKIMGVCGADGVVTIWNLYK